MNDDEYPISLLQESIGKATDVGGQYSQIYFFSDIWIPVLTRDENHAPVVGDDGNFVVTYKNVGLTTEQLADAYQTLYGYNMLSVPITDPDMLTLKMKSIFQLNVGKYMKWLDTMGYAYNPLWNVDGSESFQYIDTHGNITRTNTPILQTDQELKTAPYDSETYKATNKTINTYSGTQSTDTETHTQVTDATLDGTVHAITGGDYSHIEKRVRQGNIGVTMTTQLIQAERDLVRFNLVQEFFDDINKQLLVGVYPGF